MKISSSHFLKSADITRAFIYPLIWLAALIYEFAIMNTRFNQSIELGTFLFSSYSFFFGSSSVLFAILLKSLRKSI